MISIPVLTDTLSLRRAAAGTEVHDPFRKRWVRYTPEEAIRQNLLRYCTAHLGYPARRIAVEKAVPAPGIAARFDAVVYDAALRPWMLIECKAPEVPIREQALLQLLRYHHALRCRYWVLYNGIDCYCADAGNPENIVWLRSLPAYEVIVGRTAE